MSKAPPAMTSPDPKSQASTPEKVLGELADLSSFRKLFVKTTKPRGKKGQASGAGRGSKSSKAAAGSATDASGNESDGSEDSSGKSKKSKKVQLLAYQRAMNCGIAFAKLKAPLQTVLQAVRLLTPKRSTLGVEPTTASEASPKGPSSPSHRPASSGAGESLAPRSGGAALVEGGSALAAIAPIPK